MSLDVPVRLFRYRPGSAPRYARYRVQVPEAATVIDVLEAVWRQDATLLYRHACHHASCGTCAVRLNGYERLPCIVPVGEALAGRAELLIEPLRNFPLLGDLLVEVGGFFARQAETGLGLIREVEETGAAEMLAAAGGGLEKRPVTRFENCIECGICLSACPTLAASDRFFGPAGLAAVERAYRQTREGPQRARLLALADGAHGVWQCHSAWECTEACPQEVRPAEAIMALRRELVVHKLKALLGGQEQSDGAA